MDREAIEKLISRWTTEAIAAGRLDVFDQVLTDSEHMSRTTRTGGRAGPA